MPSRPEGSFYKRRRILWAVGFVSKSWTTRIETRSDTCQKFRVGLEWHLGDFFFFPPTLMFTLTSQIPHIFLKLEKSPAGATFDAKRPFTAGLIP